MKFIQRGQYLKTTIVSDVVHHTNRLWLPQGAANWGVKIESLSAVLRIGEINKTGVESSKAMRIILTTADGLDHSDQRSGIFYLAQSWLDFSVGGGGAAYTPQYVSNLGMQHQVDLQVDNNLNFGEYGFIDVTINHHGQVKLTVDVEVIYSVVELTFEEQLQLTRRCACNGGGTPA